MARQTRHKINREIPDGILLKDRQPIESYKREAEEQLRLLMEKKFTEDDLIFRKRINDNRRLNKGKYNFKFCVTNYVSEMLDKLFLYREKLGAENSPLIKHIEFLYVLGLSKEQILYSIFTMGYVTVTIDQLKEHFKKKSVKVRIEKVYDEYMSEINILRRKVFQDMAGQTMEAEREHLQKLLKDLGELQAEFALINPVTHPKIWNTLNKQIDGILTQCKAMHGIDEIRSAQIKTEAAITVQSSSSKGESRMLETRPNKQLEDERIVTLSEETAIIDVESEY